MSVGLLSLGIGRDILIVRFVMRGSVSFAILG